MIHKPSTIDSPCRPHARLRFLLRAVVYTGLLWLLFAFCMSSFLLRNLWLPLAARAAGCEITVGEAILSPIRSGQNLVLRDLTLTDQSGNHFRAGSIRATVSLFRLLTGVLDVDAVAVTDAELELVRLPEASKPGAAYNTDDLRIGSVEADRLLIRHGPAELLVTGFTLSGVGRAESNILKSDLTLAVHTADTGIERLALRLESRFSLDRQFQVRDVLLTIAAKDGRGQIRGRDLSDFTGNFSVHAFVLPDAPVSGEYRIDATLTADLIDCFEHLSVQLRDARFRPAGLTGEFPLTLSAALSDYRVERLYLPESTTPGETRDYPEAIRIDQELLLTLDGESLRVRGDGTLRAARIWYNGHSLLEDLQFQLRQDWSCDRADGRVELRRLEAALTSSGKTSGSIRNSGTLVYDPVARRIAANNSSLSCSLRNLPLLPFGPDIPVDPASGELSFDVTLAADSVRQALQGALSFSVAGLSLNNAGSPLLLPQDISGTLALHSTGLDDVRALQIDDCRASVTHGGTTALSADLSGIFRFRERKMALDGSVQLVPYEFAARVNDPLAEAFRAKLRKFHSENLRNTFRVHAELNGRAKTLDFRSETLFNSMAVFGDEFRTTPLSWMLNGRFAFPDGGGSTLTLESGILSEKLIDLAASGIVRFPANSANLNLNLKKLSPEFLKGLARLSEPRTPAQRNIVSKFRYDTATGSASVSADLLKRTFRIHPLRFEIMPVPGSHLRLSLDTPVLGRFSERPQLTNTQLSLSVENFPLEYCNIFIPDSSDFFFAGGVGQGNSEMVLRDSFRTVEMKNEILIESLAFKYHDSILDFHDCRILGDSAFTGLFDKFEFRHPIGRVYYNDREILTLSAAGYIGLQDENITAVNFDVIQTAPPLLGTLFGDVADNFQVQKFDAAGQIRWEAADEFDENRLYAALAFKNVSFGLGPAERYAPRPLSGEMALSFSSTPGLLTFRNSSLRLVDAHHVPVLQASLDGDFHSHGTRQTECRLTSDAVDLEFFLRALMAKRSKSVEAEPSPAPLEPVPVPLEPVPVPLAPAAPVAEAKTAEVPADVRRQNAPWPFRGEPPVFRLYGYRTALTIDFKNVTCTEYVDMALSGVFRASDDRLDAERVTFKVNEATATLSAGVALSAPDGYEYAGTIDLGTLSVVPLIRAFSLLKQTPFPLDGVRGTLEKFNASVRGKGLSLDNLDRNLKIRANAEVSELSLPLAAKDSISLLRVLFLPIEYLPRLIDLIPERHVRSVFQVAMGNHVDLLTGRRNIEFDRGVIELETDQTDFRVRKMYFTGPDIKTRIVRGSFNPFYNEIDLESLTRFSGVTYPLAVYGKLDSPEIDYKTFLLRFWAHNAAGILTGTASAVTLGLTDAAGDADWAKPATP